MILFPASNMGGLFVVSNSVQFTFISIVTNHNRVVPRETLQSYISQKSLLGDSGEETLTLAADLQQIQAQANDIIAKRIVV